MITIDDLLPVTEFNSFVFTRSQKKQLFASFIEKALAKMHGSYKALESGMKVFLYNSTTEDEKNNKVFIFRKMC